MFARRVAVAVGAAGAAGAVAYGWRESGLVPAVAVSAAAAASDEERKKRVVVLGTGWGAVSFLKGLKARDDVEVTVVSPRNYFINTPFLPSVTTGALSPGSVCESLYAILTASQREMVSYVGASCVGIDLDARTVTCRDESAVRGAVSEFALEYDALVVAIGAEPNDFGVKGVKEHAQQVKEIEDAVAIKRAVVDRLETAVLPGQPAESRKQLLHLVVVGGGPTGVETAAEIHDLVRSNAFKWFPEDILEEDLRMTIIQSADHLLNCYDESIAVYATEKFKRDGVEVLTGKRVKEVKADRLVVQDKASKEIVEMPYGLLVWSTGNKPRALARQIMRQLPEEQTNRRALLVDSTLRLRGRRDVYALGDCATVADPAIAQVAEIFEAADTDKDGTISRAEFDALLPVAAKRYPQLALLLRRSHDLFAEFDKDKSGTLCIDEVRALLRAADSEMTSHPATAQVAAQQGEYLAAQFNETGGDADKADAYGLGFHYNHLGSMVYIGSDEAGADLGKATISGGFGSAWLWKGTHTFKQASLACSITTAADFLRTLLFGRNVTGW